MKVFFWPSKQKPLANYNGRFWNSAAECAGFIWTAENSGANGGNGMPTKRQSKNVRSRKYASKRRKTNRSCPASMSFYEFLRNNNFHWTFWKMIFGERKINSSCLFVCFFQHKISTVVVISRFLKIAQWAISYILMNDPHSEMCCFF